MTDLIACLSTGKGTWEHVARVIQSEAWGSVFIITDEFFADKIDKKDKELIIIDRNKTISEMAEEIKKCLQGKVKDLEVAVNFVSGEGREHMALISALLQLGLGIRLVVLTKEGVKTI